MPQRWLFVQLSDLNGVPELDPDRDAVLLLHPCYDDPLLQAEPDDDTGDELASRRWEAWLAS